VFFAEYDTFPNISFVTMTSAEEKLMWV